MTAYSLEMNTLGNLAFDKTPNGTYILQDKSQYNERKKFPLFFYSTLTVFILLLLITKLDFSFYGVNNRITQIAMLSTLMVCVLIVALVTIQFSSFRFVAYRLLIINPENRSLRINHNTVTLPRGSYFYLKKEGKITPMPSSLKWELQVISSFNKTMLFRYEGREEDEIMVQSCMKQIAKLVHIPLIQSERMDEGMIDKNQNFSGFGSSVISSYFSDLTQSRITVNDYPSYTEIRYSQINKQIRILLLSELTTIVFLLFAIFTLLTPITTNTILKGTIDWILEIMLLCGFLLISSRILLTLTGDNTFRIDGKMLEIIKPRLFGHYMTVLHQSSIQRLELIEEYHSFLILIHIKSSGVPIKVKFNTGKCYDCPSQMYWLLNSKIKRT